MKEETCSSFDVPCRLVEIQDSMAWEKMQPGLGHVLGWGRVVELSFWDADVSKTTETDGHVSADEQDAAPSPNSPTSTPPLHVHAQLHSCGPV